MRCCFQTLYLNLSRRLSYNLEAKVHPKTVHDGMGHYHGLGIISYPLLGGSREEQHPHLFIIYFQ